MNRPELLEKLNRATDKAASLAIERGIPIPKQTTSAWVGKTLIKKNKSDFYDIYSLDNKLLYKDISTFDIATIISQRYSAGQFKAIENVLELENSYAKHRTDMMHYLHCMKAAKKRRDYDTLAILEDKFQLSEQRAKNTKSNIVIYKKT